MVWAWNRKVHDNNLAIYVPEVKSSKWYYYKINIKKLSGEVGMAVPGSVSRQRFPVGHNSGSKSLVENDGDRGPEGLKVYLD